MAYTYLSVQSTLKRTVQLWFFSNLGGTLLLASAFASDRLSDWTIALLAGTVAALVSLCVVPLAVPYFNLMEKLNTSWSRRTMALAGVSLFYATANQLLLLGGPFHSLRGLLSISFPYLAAALLTVLWLYGGPVLRQR